MPLNRVTGAFFHTVGMPLLRGRDFDDSEYERSPRVIVVNRDFAEQFWPGGDCLGRTILVDDKPHEIVGVVPYDNFRRSGERCRPFLFQLEFGSNRMFVHVKGDAQRIRPLLREEIMRVDPKVPISEELSLMEMIRNFFMPVTLTLGVLGFASVLGVLLSAIALYGTLALNVTQRTREIGIRMALGARRSAVVCSTLQEGMGLAGLGIVLGLAGGFGLACLLRRLLYGIGTTDVATAAAATFILAAVALLACWLPARRAARVHPMEALRYE